MKGFKKYTIILLSICMLVIASCSRSTVYNLQPADVSGILETIKYLSSKDFNGRMAGTEYGIKTENYVASMFKKAGLKPGGVGGTFFQKFNGTSGNPSGGYALEVVDKGKIIKKYKYALDYKYFMPFPNRGDITSKAVKLDTGTSQVPAAGEAKIAILSHASISVQDSKFYSGLYNSGYRGLIVQRDSASSRVKGQSGVADSGSGVKLPRVCVTSGVLNELLEYTKKGYEIHLKTEFEVKSYTARNVIGIIKSAAPSDKYLIISAHMDHLGPDPDGAYFPGALDNASGTASIIQIAGILASQNVKPDINIVFIAFSGEEEMLDGSRYYVTNPIYPLQNTRVINLDMVGAKSDLPVTVLTSGTGSRSTREADIKEEIEGLAAGLKYNIETISDGASDHAPFARMGVPAVTLIDYEKTVYHVPEDDISNIGPDNLRRDVTLAMKVIAAEAYGKEESTNNLYKYFACTIFIFCAAVSVYRKRKV